MKLLRTLRKAGVIAGVLMVVTASPATAQQTESRIVGRLVDESKATLPGVAVTVTSKQTGSVRTAVSGGDGSYAVTNLSPGEYVVAFELPGFAGQTREVTLRVGQIETANVTLGVGVLQEAVTVTGDRPVIDLTSARIGVNVSPAEVENLPVNGRNFANLMTLATGATSDGNGGWASVRFNGKSNQQNYLNYDGVDGTYVWDASPGFDARGTTGIARSGLLIRATSAASTATTLPNGTPGVPFTDAQAGTFGYMLGPLNRTVGLGTARQTQISIRYLF